MPTRSARQRKFDEVFPTVVRYLGVATVVFYGVGRSAGLDVPDSLLIAAAGMIGYKTVKSGGEGRASND